MEKMWQSQIINIVGGHTNFSKTDHNTSRYSTQNKKRPVTCYQLLILWLWKSKATPYKFKESKLVNLRKENSII